MEVNKNNGKQTKKLYACLFAVLLCLAVIVGITTAVSNHKNGEALVEAKDSINEDREKLEGYDFYDGYDEVWSENEKNNPGTEIIENEGEENKPSDSAIEDDAFQTDEGADIVDAAVNDGNNENVFHDDKTVSQDGELPDFAPPVGGAVIVSFSDVTPVFSVTMNDYRTHLGVDIEAEEGEAVLSCATGVIGAVWDDPMMGKCLTVVHSGGAVSCFKGVYETLPEGICEGAWVEKGQVIAAVGSTALAEVAEESHVHYELTVDGKNVDPTEYIDFTAVMKWED